MNVKPCPLCNSLESTIERTIDQIDLIACDFCGFVFTNLEDHVIIKANSKMSDGAILRYSNKQSVFDEMWFQRIVEKFPMDKKKNRILDIGCGNSLLLKKFIDRGWEVYGLDISPWAVEFADHYGFKLYMTTLEHAEIPSNKFDLVVSTSTFEHIPRPVEHVREILRVLKPGGIAYLSGIPNYHKITRGMKISYIYNNPPAHANFFTANSMKVLFSQPQIDPHIRSIDVKTYGIPELHVFFKFGLQLVKKLGGLLRRKPKQLGGAEDGQVQNTLRYEAKPVISWKETLVRTLVEINYFLGIPFSLGDKIEVMITKK